LKLKKEKKSFGKVTRFDNNYLKDPKTLMEKNVFGLVYLEVKEKCPYLFQVLNCAIGNKVTSESKIATIATIYGMLMHSRNRQASAIQRMFSAIAVRFHADNKVCTI